MEEDAKTSQHSSSSSRLISIASVFVLLSIIFGIAFVAISFKVTVWISLHVILPGLSICTLLLLKKRHPTGRICAIWAPWFALAVSMPIFHRALYLVSHYAPERHPGFQETMAFFFCIGYAIIMLPASILLLQPAVKATFLRSGHATLTQQAAGRLPWSVWTAAALYCLPFLFALFILCAEFVARESTGDQGPLVDLIALCLLFVAISIIGRNRIARAFALWLPFCLFLLGIIVARGMEYLQVGEIIFSATYETMMISGFLILAALVSAPAIIFLNLHDAKNTFHPVTSMPPESLPDTTQHSPPDIALSP